MTLAKFAPNSDSVAIFAFAAGHAQVWDLRSRRKIYDVDTHSQVITDVSFTPLEGMVAVCSQDSSWSLHDFHRGRVLLHLQESAKITSLQFHPDGLITAIGLSNGKILIYDIRDMQLAQELEGPAPEAVSQLSFSNKGIFLAASWTGQDVCRVYSLHKGFIYSEVKLDGSPITAVSFDLFGGFLALGSSEKMVISSYKNWKKVLNVLKPFNSGGVDAIRFDTSGHRIFVSNRSHGEVKTLSLQ